MIYKFKIGDIVVANEKYGETIPVGTHGVIVDSWAFGHFPVVDWTESLGPTYCRYYMMPDEVEIVKK